MASTPTSPCSRRMGGRWQRTTDGGGGRNARIAPLHPARRRPLSCQDFPPWLGPQHTDPYTLTLAALTPHELVLGQPASSTTQNDMLWTFEGRAGQIVDIAMTTADPDFDPYLTLQQADGRTLAEDDNGGGSSTPESASFFLPTEPTSSRSARPTARLPTSFC